MELYFLCRAPVVAERSRDLLFVLHHFDDDTNVFFQIDFGRNIVDALPCVGRLCCVSKHRRRDFELVKLNLEHCPVKVIGRRVRFNLQRDGLFDFLGKVFG